jgi:hypothetical protein
MADATPAELQEAVSVAASVRYFSSVLHGAEIDVGDFAEETGQMVEYIEEHHG